MRAEIGDDDLDRDECCSAPDGGAPEVGWAPDDIEADPCAVVRPEVHVDRRRIFDAKLVPQRAHASLVVSGTAEAAAADEQVIVRAFGETRRDHVPTDGSAQRQVPCHGVWKRRGREVVRAEPSLERTSVKLLPTSRIVAITKKRKKTLFFLHGKCWTCSSVGGFVDTEKKTCLSNPSRTR